jgi:hypothetical protein
MDPLTFYFVLIISLVGIAFAGYKEWLKFRAKQNEIGPPSDVAEQVRALRERLNEVERERDALRSRVENLETIVTSEAWDRLQTPSGNTDAVEHSPHSIELPASESSSADRAEALARRLRS